METATATVYREKIILVLQDIRERSNLNEIWRKVEKIIKIKEVLGYVSNKIQRAWFNKNCKSAQDERDRARMKVTESQ